MVMNQRYETGNKVDFLDQLETNVDMVADVADQQADRHAQRIDAEVFSAVATAISTAANISDVGTSTNYVPSTGIGATTAADALLFDAIEDFALKVQVRKLSDDTGQVDQNVFIVMPPYLFRNLRRYILSKDWAEILNFDIIRDNRVARPTDRAVAHLFRMPIYVSNNIPDVVVSVGGSNKDFGQVLCGSRSGTQFAMRPGLMQVISPTENQTAPQWWIRSVIIWGIKVVDEGRLYKIRVRQES